MDIVIKLEHSFVNNCPNIKELLDGCYKLNTYTSRLENLSRLEPDKMSPEHYKGDGFELLVEAIIKLSTGDDRIGITDYHPIEKGEDIGVDGYGFNSDGKPATVQVKYRSNPTQELTPNKDMIGNFVAASLLKHRVDPDSNKSMFIFTNAAGLNHFADNEMYEKKVQVIAYEKLNTRLMNNHAFWDSFRELLNLNEHDEQETEVTDKEGTVVC